MPASAGSAEERLWRELYDQNVGWVFGLLGRLGVAEGDRADLAQRAFELAFRKGKAGLPPEEVGPWLRGAVVNLVRNHRRWQRVRRASAWIVEGLFATKSPDAHAALETRTHVSMVLDRMPPTLRDALVLADIEDLHIEEVARLLRVPLNTARWRRTRAREVFRELFRELEESADHEAREREAGDD